MGLLPHPQHSYTPRCRGLLYLQLQVSVNLWSQQTEEVGCSGELEPWKRIRCGCSVTSHHLPVPPPACLTPTTSQDSPGMISSVTAAPPITWRLSKTAVFTPSRCRYAA